MTVCIDNILLETGERDAIGNVRNYNKPSSHLSLPLFHQMSCILKCRFRLSYGRRSFHMEASPLGINLTETSLYSGFSRN